MEKQCAYCGKKETLTLEHIWSSCLIERLEGEFHTYNRQQDKFYKGDPTIRDVCQNCNNVRLSVLDTYLCSLYEKYFSEFIKPGDAAKLGYNYDMLLRSLLKISYNSSRTYKENLKNIKLHEKYSKYILGDGYRPQQIMLRLQIVTSAKVVRLDSGEEKMVHPDALRCAEIAYDGVLNHRFMIRLVAIKSYWFYIISPYKLETKAKYNEFLNSFKKWRIQPGVLVSPNSSELDIPVEKTTYDHNGFYKSLENAAKKKWSHHSNL